MLALVEQKRELDCSNPRRLLLDSAPGSGHHLTFTKDHR
jgi:hypothetical protein